MTTQSTDEQPGESQLFIFLNDFTDSDNEAAAELWAWFLKLYPNVKGIYIAEPRWVNLGYYMTSKDFGRCIGLVGKLQPPLEGDDPPLTTVLAGRLTEDIINSRQVDGRLNDDERDLLMRCIKPANGSRLDSIQHAELVALDYLTTMRSRCSRFDAYIDVEGLDKLESPINLKTHYHDELVARSYQELEEFRAIMELPTYDESRIEDRRARLRHWYNKALDRKRNEFGGTSPFKELRYDDLFNEIRSYDKVTFFGGASLTVLQELLEREPSLGKKVHYYQQGGTFNSKLNILGNPYNFALNTAAAEYVFEHQGKLGSFTVIPTDTTKRIEWTVKGLSKLSPAVGVRSLAFHGRYDPWEMVSEKERDGASHTTQEFLSWRSEWASDPAYSSPNSKGYKAIMADLTAFLAAFTGVFSNFPQGQGSLRQTSIKVTIDQTIPHSNQMVLVRNAESKIECLIFEPQGQDALLVEDAIGLLEYALDTTLSAGWDRRLLGK